MEKEEVAEDVADKFDDMRDELIGETEKEVGDLVEDLEDIVQDFKDDKFEQAKDEISKENPEKSEDQVNKEAQDKVNQDQTVQEMDKVMNDLKQDLENKLEAGDLMVTTGTSGYFPKGYSIGTVKSVGIDSSGLSACAEIEPCIDISRLSSVVVITDFSGKNTGEEETENED